MRELNSFPDGEVALTARVVKQIFPRRISRTGISPADSWSKESEPYSSVEEEMEMSDQQESQEQKGSLVGSSFTSLEFTRRNFKNPALEWRRLFSDTLGTFLLVLVGAGAGVVNAVSQVQISPYIFTSQGHAQLTESGIRHWFRSLKRQD